MPDATRPRRRASSRPALLAAALALALGFALPAAAQEAATPPAAEPAAAPVPADAATPADATTPGEATTPATGEPATLEAVVVTGTHPGPGLWQVRNDAGHVLWIMGTISPLPKRIDWEPRELDLLVQRAGRVLAGPGASVDADIGFFGRLGLVPAAMRARNDPDGRPLSEVLPPELYARWEVQKALYMGRDRGVERRRPLLAAGALMDEALDDLDLRRDNLAWERVRRQARRHDVEIVTPRVSVRIEDPREALREFASSTLEDEACMRATLARLETDTRAMRMRANAWAVGDLQTLREMPFESELRVCALALLESEALRRRGLTDLPPRALATWLEAAETALAEVPSTVAVLDMQVLLADDGVLAGLRERGYTVLAPDDPGAEEALEAAIAAGDAEAAEAAD